MKKINVYTHYDSNKKVIAQIKPHIMHPDGYYYISRRTYNRLLNLRTVGGNTGIYTDSSTMIAVYDERTNSVMKWI